MTDRKQAWKRRRRRKRRLEEEQETKAAADEDLDAGLTRGSAAAATGTEASRRGRRVAERIEEQDTKAAADEDLDTGLTRGSAAAATGTEALRRGRRIDEQETKAASDEDPDAGLTPEPAAAATASEASKSDQPVAEPIDDDEVVEVVDKIMDLDDLDRVIQSGGVGEIGADLSDRLDVASPNDVTGSHFESGKTDSQTSAADRWSQSPQPEGSEPGWTPEGAEPGGESGPGSEITSALVPEAIGADLGLDGIDSVGATAIVGDAEQLDGPENPTSGTDSLGGGPDIGDVSRGPEITADSRVAGFWDTVGKIWGAIAPGAGSGGGGGSGGHGPRGSDPDQPFDYVQGTPSGLTDIPEQSGVTQANPVDSLIQYDEGSRGGQVSGELSDDAALNPLDPYINPGGQEEGELPPGMVLPEPEDTVLAGEELPDPAGADGLLSEEGGDLEES